MSANSLKFSYTFDGIVGGHQSISLRDRACLDGDLLSGSYNQSDDVTPDSVAAIQARSDLYRGDHEWIFPDCDDERGGSSGDR